jgi:putative transposon-encoded protein
VIFEAPSSLKEIGRVAFYLSAVRSIEIPEKCNVLDGALHRMKSVSVSGRNPFFIAEGETIISVDKKKLIHYFGSSSRIVIPKSVEVIGGLCFLYRHSMSEVIFEGNSKLKRIDESAFWWTALKSIRITATVELIGEHCFWWCSSLTEVIFEAPSSLKEIGPQAFLCSAVRSIEIPEKCSVLDRALYGLKSVSVSGRNPFFIAEGETIISVDKKKLIHYFGSSSRIVIPKSVEVIGSSCFVNCHSLSEVIFENDSNLKRIDEDAFSISIPRSSDVLKSVRIPATVEFIFCCCRKHDNEY